MSRTVTLPTGLVVPEKGVWLYESCPDHETKHYRSKFGSNIPPDMDSNGRSATLVQVKCPTCGLYALWVPRAATDTGLSPERAGQ